jgi:HD-GYP domain-containing protein (c-di-GMP phosphodiesterase class II)
MKSESNLKQYLPHSFAATFLVVVVPVLLESALKLAGLLTSPFLAIALAVILAGGAATAGAGWWARRPGSRDLVFAELMIWGLVRRFRTERRLTRASGLLGVGEGATGKTAGGRHSVEMLERLSSALEARDAYTHGHGGRVARLSHMIATRMGVAPGEVAKIRTAAAIHDVGKISTPRAILNKPTRLTDGEVEVMRRHPADGAAMTAGINDPDITAMVMHHHERLDGSGYPDQLAGEEIPLGARIIAVADTFDSITSTRPYRPALRHTRAIEVLNREAGSRLDSKAVSAFMSYYSGRKEIEGWALASQVPQQFAGWLGGVFRGVAAPVTQAAATVAAAAMLSGAALGFGVDRHSGAEAHAGRPSVAASYEVPRVQTENSKPSLHSRRHHRIRRRHTGQRPTLGGGAVEGAEPRRGAGPAGSGPARGGAETAPATSPGDTSSPAPSSPPPSTPQSVPSPPPSPTAGGTGTDPVTQPATDPANGGKKNGIGVGGVPPGHVDGN